MRSDGGNYNTSMMANIADNLRDTFIFLLQNWRLLLPVVGAVTWYLNRETDEEKKRRPELLDQIVAMSEARCEKPGKYPEMSPYQRRLREAISETRSQSFDRYMDHKATICLNQNLPAFTGGNFFSKSFYGAYHYNEGQPVISLWDKGKAVKDAGFTEQKIDKWGGETLDKFAQHFLNGANPPATDMLAFETSKSCGKRCRTYYIEWVLADEFRKGLTQNPQIAQAPLLKERVPVEYKTLGTQAIKSP